MIDRQARIQMVSALRSYMDENITAFQLDEALSQAMETTEDETVKSIGLALWFHYDDLKDHKIVASKEQWDYFSRLLLLLESDGEIEVVRTRTRWHSRQGVAALCLVGFAFLTFRTGFGEHLFAYAIPFGAVSMILAWFSSRRRKSGTPSLEVVMTPFPSASSILAVRRRVPGFAKRRYPGAITSRRIRDPFIDKLMLIPWLLMWLMFSPVPLFFQMLPDRESETRITMPEPSGGGDALSRAAHP